MTSRLSRAWNILRRRGPGYLVYILTGYLVPRLVYHLVYAVPRRYLKGMLLAGVLVAAAGLLLALARVWTLPGAIILLLATGGLALLVWQLARWLRLRRMIARARKLSGAGGAISEDGPFVSWSGWSVDPQTRQAVETAREANPATELVIGHIDNDGRVLGVFGELPGVENVGEGEYVARRRYPVDIVLIGDNVLVRKDFNGDRQSFIREWLSSSLLEGKANVPSIYNADEAGLRLYKRMLLGRTLRDLMVEAGASILTVQVQDDPELAGLEPLERIKAVWARGRAVLPSVVAEDFVGQIQRQMDDIHRKGITGLSLTFGNIFVAPDGSPWLLDFDGVRFHRSTQSAIFQYRRDQDRVKFNQVFDRDILTERSARAALSAAKASHWYAPIDLGNGLATRGFWTTESGVGRWDYFNRHVIPALEGKRVLDLGCNNGVMPMMMLRAGAREVVGLEISPEAVAQARLVHQLFEWRDMRRYAFHVHSCDMREILHSDWGAFDLVTSFCTLYYLTHEDMARVVRKASELAPRMVVQANTGTRPEAADDKAWKSSSLFLRQLMVENGFPIVDEFSPRGFVRPILRGAVQESIPENAAHPAALPGV